MKDYKKQAEDFLKKANATIEIIKAKQQQAPIWAKNGEDYGYMYNITIKREGKRNWTFNFWDSIANKKAIELLENNKAIIPLFSKLDGKEILKNVFEYEGLKYDIARREYKKKIEAGDFSPSSYNILACITKYNPGTFSDFCSEYGYDEDSKTAEKTFIAVVNEWNECERMFSDLMEELQEIN